MRYFKASAVSALILAAAFITLLWLQGSIPSEIDVPEHERFMSQQVAEIVAFTGLYISILFCVYVYTRILGLFKILSRKSLIGAQL